MKSLLLKRLRTKNNYLQDWIPARILRFVIGNETAGGEKEKNKNTSAFHLKKRKYFLCWAQNYLKREKKFTWHLHGNLMPHSNETLTLVHWKCLTIHLHCCIFFNPTDRFNFGSVEGWYKYYWHNTNLLEQDEKHPKNICWACLGKYSQWCCFILLKWDLKV